MSPAKSDPALQSAIRHHQAGRLDKAESIYRQVLARQPSQPDALHQLGILAARRGDRAEAESLLRRAIAARPNFPDALANLGNILISRGENFADAAAILEQSLALNPRNAIALSNLSFALREIGRFDQAADAARESLAIQPDRADPLNNLGSALEELGQFTESIDCFRRAIARDPNAAAIHLNLAQALLRQGDYANGWREYEWRWKSATFRDAQRTFLEPRWDGSDLRGRSIFLHAEQGLGDTIQFLRYVPLVKERSGAARVILEVPSSLKRLCESLGGVDELIAAAPGDRPQGDVRCALMSLPFMLELVDREHVCREVPYLKSCSDPGLAAPACKKFNVGLLASGNPSYRRDAERSIPSAALASLAPLSPQIRFYSLKKRSASDPPLDLPLSLEGPAPAFNDFADTAAFIDQLDLVISVDSAVAHLAGAMGKQTWLLLSHIRDWRWPIAGETTPWYPTMRIFRQERRGEWEPVIRRVADELLKRAGTG